jgi:hemin uptake protein HemP
MSQNEHDNHFEAPPKIMNSDQLFEETRTVHIMHEGSQYVLRKTRRNKLILTKPSHEDPSDSDSLRETGETDERSLKKQYFFGTSRRTSPS